MSKHGNDTNSFSYYACLFPIMLPLPFQTQIDIKYVSGSLLLDCYWSVPHERPSTPAWRFILSPTMIGLHRSTRTKSFRGDCKKRKGYKVSSRQHSQSMTLPSGIALRGTGGNGLDSEQVCLTNTCTYETYSMTKVF